MKRHAVLTLVLLLAFPGSLSAQSGSDSKATIYIYKNWHMATIARIAFAVFLNDKEIVRLDRHVYCIVRLDPGEYRFRTRFKKAPDLKLSVEAGKTYYLKLETENGGFKVKDPIISRELSEDDARNSLLLMEPVQPRDVKDKTVVLTEYPDHPAGQKRKKP